MRKLELYEALATEQAVPSHNTPAIPGQCQQTTLALLTSSQLFLIDLRNSQTHIKNKSQLNQMTQAFNKWHGARQQIWTAFLLSCCTLSISYLGWDGDSSTVLFGFYCCKETR